MIIWFLNNFFEWTLKGLLHDGHHSSQRRDNMKPSKRIQNGKTIIFHFSFNNRNSSDIASIRARATTELCKLSIGWNRLSVPFISNQFPISVCRVAKYLVTFQHSRISQTNVFNYPPLEKSNKTPKVSL
jgi:hypothetical protein